MFTIHMFKCSLVKERITHNKAPRYVIIMQEPYPLTATGKVQKFKLREMAVKALGLENIASHIDT